jgi:hypothetical protein
MVIPLQYVRVNKAGNCKWGTGNGGDIGSHTSTSRGRG